MIDGGEQDAWLPGKFFPKFDPILTEYLVELPENCYNVVVSPTLSDPNATSTVGFATQGLKEEAKPPKANPA